MTEIVRGGQSGSLDHIDSSQATFRTQIAALTDAVRQLSGAAEIGAGAVVNDPLSAPYVFYVNPFTGKDTFVSGNYSTSGTATERIELQRLECGYTEARPFKTINRAIIEAGIITAKSYYENPIANTDLVSIILMPGVTTIYNGTGAASVSEWATNKEPTNAELTEFNSNSTGGLLLPRGVSLCGIDLRKTILRPDVVPAVADEAADASNRRAIFKVTGTGYYFGFTFMDKAGSTASHHLLDGFHFASETELDEFYTKIRQAFGGTNNTGGLDNDLAVTNINEYQITGPQPASGSQTIATDTTTSASPYIFNISTRSNYGMCGVYADGDKPSGFKSIVLAQFTAVSLQRDLNCWQKYSSGSWGAFADYDDFISTGPDNVRMNPSRRSFHIRAVNNAVIQEVSVFAIGQGVHHWTQNGGEITITNSNSNFGGCAAISEGYRGTSFTADTDWNVSRLRVSNNLSELSSNVRRIYLGTISAVTSSSITLTTALGESQTVAGVPEIVAKDGYTLREDSYVWVENPLGKDWRSTFAATAWSTSDTDLLNIKAALADEDSEAAGTTDPVGKRVYIRRIVDTRTPAQRRYTLKLANTGTARLPLRDYVLQTDTTGTSIDSAIDADETLLINSSGKTTISGVTNAAEITLRRGNASVTWASGELYKKGQTVKRADKHFTCIEENEDTTFDANKWDESFVHMPSDYNTEDFYKNESPILIFDRDTSGSEDSTTLGYNFSTLWGSDTLIQEQYRGATDYLGMHLLLTALGFTSAQAHTLLTPQAEANRELDPSSSTDMDGYVPSGAANSLANWPIEFRRPSVIRLFGHAWEWAGFLNYTKAIPKYQGNLSAQNKFTYYFTNVDGGRVYATGFNEEGYQVTPRGLEDVSTGQTLSVENLGANDITIDTPTEFTDLTLNGTTTINDTLVINATNVTFPEGLNATTTRAGVGEIASITDIDNAGTATADSQLNSAGARFVTPEGLNYWKTENQLLSRRSGVQYVYVDPVNGNNRTTAQLLETPPTSFGARAKSLTQLAGYINQVYSPEETVEVRLCPGYYLESGTITFTPKMRMRSASATDGSLLCDLEDGGSIPFMGQTTASSERGKAWNQTRSYLTNDDNHPIFLTRPRVNFPYSPTQIRFSLEPLTFVFEQDAEVVGCVWLGAAETLINSNVPDSFFSVSSGVSISTVRSDAQGDADNALNYFIKAEVDNRVLTDSTATWQYLVGGQAISARANLSVYNCAFEAIAPSDQDDATSDPEAVIYARNGDILIRGVWLIGNAKVSSDLTGAPSFKGDSTYFLTGHHQSFLAGFESQNEVSDGFRLSLGGFRETSGGSSDDADYNYTWNNIHLVANDLSYRDAWDPFTPPSVTGTLLTETPAGTNWKSIGPGFKGFLGQLKSFRQFDLFWHAAFQSTANHAQGFAGIFGRISLLDDSTPKTKGILSIPSGFVASGYFGRPTLVRRAGTGAAPSMSSGIPTDPGEVGSNEDFDDLNVQVTPIRKGIDVDNVVTVTQHLKI